MVKKIYFGHPLSEYGTRREKELSKIIEDQFPKYVVENPNQEKHQQGYINFKLRKGNGMRYFYEKVLPFMDAGIFLLFQDGKLGAGVYAEAEFLNKLGKPIYQIDHDGEISDLVLDPSSRLTIAQTVERLESLGVVLRPDQI
jgi:hypothetical protein